VVETRGAFQRESTQKIECQHRQQPPQPPIPTPQTPTHHPRKQLKRAGSDSVGWVGGVTPKAPIPNCPSGFSQKTCTACLSSKDPATCFVCVSKPQVYYGSARACAACADLPDGTQRATCAKCVSELTPSKGCATCLFYDTTGQRLDPQRSSKCFACVIAGGEANRGAAACPACFLAPSSGNVIDTDTCLACASDPKRSPAARAGCAACYDGSTQDRAGCLACIGGAGSAERAAACGSCSYKGMGDLTAQCYECLKTVGGGASYCSFLGQVLFLKWWLGLERAALACQGLLALVGRMRGGEGECLLCFLIAEHTGDR